MNYSALPKKRDIEIEVMSRLRIAIIEDSINIRKRLVELVEEMDDMEVVGVASTEIEAINICQQTSPDAIILDMQLEVGNGLGVMRAMQYNAAKPKPTIIILTNFPSPSLQRAAISLGADTFLDKSLEFHKLPGLLSSAADNLPSRH